MKIYLLLFLLIAVCSCSKPATPAPPVVLDKTSLQLFYDETYQYQLTQGSQSVDPSTFSWESSDSFVATVSRSGLLTAKHIGNAVITGTSADKQTILKANVTIKPYSTAWAEPVTYWGYNKASVKLAETRKLVSESADLLYYYGDNSRIRSVGYVFASDKLGSSIVFLESTVSMATEAVTYLRERYQLESIQGGVYFFTDRSQKLSIGITSDNTLGLLVQYLPYTKSGRLASSPVFDMPNTASTALSRLLSSSSPR